MNLPQNAQGTVAIKKIRVLVADDHEVARAGIAALLEAQPDIEVIGEAKDGVEAVDLIAKLKPDVSIVDFRMPGLGGVSVTNLVLKSDPGAQILVFTHHDGDEPLFASLTAGARGFLNKDSDGTTLIAAVRTLARGDRFLLPEAGGRYADRAGQKGLSVREKAVLGLVAEGLTNRLIAQTLGMSERTAAADVSAILEKLGVRTRAEAVAVAVQRGLLDR